MCNKKNKIAFVCSTYVQIMRMFQIKKEIPEFYGKADLYLVHDMFNNMEFIRRLENTNEFDNVFYFNVNEYKSIKVLHYIYGKKYRDIFKKNIYDKVISFNIEEVISQVLFNLNKSQENFEFHCVEDGPGGYEVYKPEQYKWSHIYRWLGIEKQYYNIKTWWTGCPEYMKFPNDCSVDIKKLPAIKIGDYKLLKTINYVFDYKNENELDNIEVYDIDNLKDIHDKNDKKRKELAKIGYEMISEKIIEFTEWLDSIKIDPTIESLNDKCLEIREDTLEYIYRKTNLNNRDKKIIDKMLTSALKRLIREPIINLKQTKDKGKREEYIKLVEELFEL